MQRIAQVLKSNGKDGELVIGFIGMDPEDIDIKEPVFIEDEGLPVPYFFHSFQRRGNTKAIVRITGVNSLDDAEELVGRSIYADWDYDNADESFEGWILADATGATVGTIDSYEDIPGNLCINVTTPRGTVLVPLHEELIISADPDSRVLTMRLPEGILEL